MQQMQNIMKSAEISQAKGDGHPKAFTEDEEIALFTLYGTN